MNSFFRLSLLIAFVFSISSCQKKAAQTKSTPPKIAAHLNHNQLSNLPSGILREFADSPIHWQAWEPKIIDDAKSSKRLIFALAITAAAPSNYQILRAIDKNPELVNTLNNNFIPVLIDADINREIRLYTASLSQEVQQAVSLPFLMILSTDGAPISWKGLSYLDDELITTTFDSAISVVLRLWQEAPEYVISDSKQKLQRRLQHPPKLESDIIEQEERVKIVQQAIRLIINLYNSDTKSIDGLGGLVPNPMLNFLSHASTADLIDSKRREECNTALNSLFSAIYTGPMVDPLDGGIYSARRHNTWSSPVYYRDLNTQADTIYTLSRLAKLNHISEAVNIALSMVQFTENQYQTSDGLFSASAGASYARDEDYMWTQDQLRASLSEEEFEVWKIHSNIDPRGNIPIEADPSRRFFRLNTLSASVPISQISKERNLPEDEVKQLIKSGKRKLLKERESRLGPLKKDNTPSALSSFQMIRAYSGLYTATKDDLWREKAVELGKLCIKSFTASSFLNERPGENPSPMSDSRAFAYATATAACLDLYAITLDQYWSTWAIDFTTLLSENFIEEENRLSEVRRESRVLPLHAEDRSMIFGESTYGVMRKNLQSFNKLELRYPQKLASWLATLPSIANNPINYSDTLESLLIELDSAAIIVNAEKTKEFIPEITRLPLQKFLRSTTKENKSTYFDSKNGTQQLSNKQDLQQYISIQ